MISSDSQSWPIRTRESPRRVPTSSTEAPWPRAWWRTSRPQVSVTPLSKQYRQAQLTPLLVPGGIITLKDLLEYQPLLNENPMSLSIGEYTMHIPDAPSSGPVLALILNIVNGERGRHFSQVLFAFEGFRSGVSSSSFRLQLLGLQRLHGGEEDSDVSPHRGSVPVRLRQEKPPRRPPISQHH